MMDEYWQHLKKHLQQKEELSTWAILSRCSKSSWLSVTLVGADKAAHSAARALDEERAVKEDSLVAQSGFPYFYQHFLSTCPCFWQNSHVFFLSNSLTSSPSPYRSGVGMNVISKGYFLLTLVRLIWLSWHSRKPWESGIECRQFNPSKDLILGWLILGDHEQTRRKPS